jgi:hypothetical protein
MSCHYTCISKCNCSGHLFVLYVCSVQKVYYSYIAELVCKQYYVSELPLIHKAPSSIISDQDLIPTTLRLTFLPIQFSAVGFLSICLFAPLISAQSKDMHIIIMCSVVQPITGISSKGTCTCSQKWVSGLFNRWIHHGHRNYVVHACTVYLGHIQSETTRSIHNSWSMISIDIVKKDE